MAPLYGRHDPVSLTEAMMYADKGSMSYVAEVVSKSEMHICTWTACALDKPSSMATTLTADNCTARGGCHGLMYRSP